MRLCLLQEAHIWHNYETYTWYVGGDSLAGNGLSAIGYIKFVKDEKHVSTKFISLYLWCILQICRKDTSYNNCYNTYVTFNILKANNSGHIRDLVEGIFIDDICVSITRQYVDNDVPGEGRIYASLCFAN